MSKLSSSNQYNKSTNEIQEWATNHSVVSETKYLLTSTMNCNTNKYKWSKYFNNVNFLWGFHWKYVHKWKYNQGRKKYVWFADSATNAIIYCSYLVSTSEESTD